MMIGMFCCGSVLEAQHTGGSLQSAAAACTVLPHAVPSRPRAVCSTFTVDEAVLLGVLGVLRSLHVCDFQTLFLFLVVKSASSVFVASNASTTAAAFRRRCRLHRIHRRNRLINSGKNSKKRRKARACQLVRVRANKMVADVAVAFNRNLITPHSIKRTAYKQMKGDCAFILSQISSFPHMVALGSLSSLSSLSSFASATSAASAPPRRRPGVSELPSTIDDPMEALGRFNAFLHPLL